MSGLLLQTKLFKPVPRPSLIPRPHLINLLNHGLGIGDQGFSARLTLVCAPAGFGKTTLVAAWLAQLATHIPPLQSGATAWLSLDEGDNDPLRFLAYLIAALQTAAPGVGQSAMRALQSPQPPPPETVLTLLLNDTGAEGTPIILALDDYHAITNAAVHQALTFLLDHLPPLLHLLITSRRDPPLPLSRWRARSQMTELRAADLRFTVDEVRAFFNQVVDLSISDADIAALDERTEGWIAGLQMAALSMQGRDDLPALIAAYTGTQRFILDYLTDEVLEQRPRGTRNFLLQTSILDRFCGPLCQAVTGQREAQAILEQLEQANLFLVPLDEERRWYRYHHLFAEVLRNRLQQAVASPAEKMIPVAQLHRRASVWFEEQELIDEAIDHELAAPDVDRAAALVERYSLVMFQRSQIFVSRAWLERLPPQLIQTRPLLLLAQGWAMVLTGHGQALEAWLSAPQAAALAAPDLPRGVLGELALLRATQARYQHEHARSLELARQARQLLADDHRGLLAGALYTIAAAHLHQGDVATASQIFAESATVGETKGGPYMALAALQELSEIQVRQGHLTQALQTCDRSMRMATRWGWQSMPAVGMAHLYFGHVFYQRNDLDRAAQELAQGIARLRGSTDQDVLAPGYVTLSQIHMAHGDYDGAFATLRRGEEWLTQMQVGDRGAGTLLALGKVRLWLGQGRLRAAARRLETCPWESMETDIGYLQRVALVRLRLAQHRLDPRERLGGERLGHERLSDQRLTNDADEMLGQLLALKESGGWFGQVLELLVLQALACDARGHAARALTILERALGLAEAEGYVRLFVDEGQPMARLLRQARRHGLSAPYVDRLLAAFPTTDATQDMAPLLPDPLSERELEVLRLAATGASNQAIAGDLFIALSTVKKHMGNILVKLDTSNRVQAVARARELGLL